MAVGFKSALCVGKDSRNVKLTISFYLAVKKTLGARCSVFTLFAFGRKIWRHFHFSKALRHVRWISNLAIDIHGAARFSSAI